MKRSTGIFAASNSCTSFANDRYRGNERCVIGREVFAAGCAPQRTQIVGSPQMLTIDFDKASFAMPSLSLFRLLILKRIELSLVLHHNG